MKNRILLISVMVGCISGCNSGASSAVNYPATPTNLVGLNNSYKCLPSSYPGYSTINGLKIAYSSECKVADAKSSIKPSLESMAIAISNYSGKRYCTGTPLSYDSTTGLGYVLTAAHCVITNVKPANKKITPAQITVSSGKKFVNQRLDAYSNSEVTGTIKAVYIPEQYCGDPSINWNTNVDAYVCSNLSSQNGDIALLQVKFNSPVKLNSSVKLADKDLNIPNSSYIMALGYGITDDDRYNTSLFYITYQYFATNSYMGENGLSAIMNGYSINNAFYSIICGGDSGGGDFYWDGTNWQLVGVHSYGSATCGKSSFSYLAAMDISTDVRLFSSKLTNIKSANISNEQEGCHLDLATQNGFICAEPQ
ncbi:MAG: trypsin-like serine protease [Burkholderiales bacterium]|nr:trypsin-like serine protease [Burkholderiales bacterium]